VTGLRPFAATIRDRLRERRRALPDSGRVLAVRALWSCGPWWAGSVALAALADAVLPNVSAVVFGRAVGDIPAAARAGLHSAAARELLLTLGLDIGLYVASLLLNPVGTALGTLVRLRIGQDQKRRLMDAVSGPVGIAHLEDPEVLSRLDLAQGTLMTYSPADAPVTFAGSLGDRLGGFIACGIIGTFRWWLGLGLAIAWLAIRPPLRRVVLDQIAAFRGEIHKMRRSWYFLGLTNKAAFAKEVRVFGLASWVVDRYQFHWKEGMAASWRGIGQLYRRVAMLLGVVVAVFGAAIGTVAWAAVHHEVTLEQAATVLLLLPQTMAAGSISFSDISLEWMVSALPNLPELEGSLAAARTEFAGRLPAAGRPAREITFDGVSFRYPRSARDTLVNLDLRLPAGRSTALVGVNGAGKTTLVKLLCRLHDPTSGQILVDGTPLSQLDPRAWRRQVAVVFQDFCRYPSSVADNIGLGSVEHAADRDGLRRAAERAGALEFIEALPLGWETIVSREYSGGVDLSGGQWQRVALARALFAAEHGARVLILDEPTAWLDVRAEAAFFDRFLSITRDMTTLVISHRFSTVRQADHIMTLDGGRIVEQGSHASLLAAGGGYAQMYRAQAAHFAAPGAPDRAGRADTGGEAA
jgi:ATP-binding cassette subfamily B protein